MKRLQPTERMSREMFARASAVRKLVKAGLLDGELALSYVIWPPESVRERQEAKAA